MLTPKNCCEMLLDILNQAVPLLVAKWLGGIPDSKVHRANMGPIWGRQDPGGPHIGPMNFSIWAAKSHFLNQCWERPMKPLAHKRPVMQKASPCFDIVVDFPHYSAGKQLVLLSGIILCVCPANERWHYNVMSSLIGWAHAQNYPWECFMVWPFRVYH